MTDCAAGTVDSQGIELYVTGGSLFPTRTLVADVLDLPLPAGERPTDDVTSVVSKFAEKLAAGVIDYGSIELSLLQRTNTPQQATLERAFIEGDCYTWDIVLPDEAVTSYTFSGTITKFAPSREAAKKNRVAMAVAISGAVDHLENGVSVLNPPEVPAG
ncbi:hypothetical protein [Acinetobacter sp. YH12116]|nr:hypothetical protein [Acinetobacter sp. YH12116]